MKKYIGVSALIAAGTLISTAESSSETLLWKTVFSNCNQGIATSVTLSNSGGIRNPSSGTVKSLNKISTQTLGDGLNLQTSGAVGGNTSCFTPNVNVQTAGDATGWKAVFEIELEDSFSTVSLDKINLGVFSFNGGGNWQTAQDGRTAKFTVSVKKNSEESASTYTWENVKIVGSDSKSETDRISELGDSSSKLLSIAGLTPISLSASDKLTVEVTCDREGTQGGSFFGLHSIGFYSSAIPEPSMFGMLAGVGALALVASRRRRK